MKNPIIALAALLTLLTSCTTHRKIIFDSKYWTLIEKGALYKTTRDVLASTENLDLLSGPDKNRWDMRLHSDQPTHNRDTHLPAGTIIQAKSVYIDSAPLQYTFISYGGLVVGGPHDGARVDFTNLLVNSYYGRHPNPRYLVKIPSPDRSHATP